MRRATALVVLLCFGSLAAGQEPPPPPVQQPYYYPPPPPLYLPPPPRLQYVMRPLWGLFISGACIFGGTWLLTSLVAYTDGNGYAAIPLIGPLLYLKSDDGSSTVRSDNAALVVVSLLQAAGVVMAITGLLVKRRVAVTTPMVAPVPYPGGAGLALAARF